MEQQATKTLWLRPETGRYYFRKGVPERLRVPLGKTMVQISLGTSDLSVARRKHAEVAARVEADWRAIEHPRRTPASQPATAVLITRKDAVALAGEIYARLVADHEEEAGSTSRWEVELRLLQPALTQAERQPSAPKGNLGGAFGRALMAERLAGHNVDRLLAEKAVSVSILDRRRICSHAASAMAQAYGVLLKRAAGDYSPDPRANRFPPALDFSSWRTWYSDYCDAKLPEPASRKRQLGVLAAFFEFVGHDAPGRVKNTDAVAWMQKRLKDVSHSTVRKADLAHPRSFFAWCKAGLRLPTNPFLEVHVPQAAVNKRRLADGTPQAIGRMRGYTREEATKVLEATLLPAGSKRSKHGAAARRWIPWLCAYTGARVGEMAQLRRKDVYEAESEDGAHRIWVLFVTPEAGRVKDYEEREVALHPHLIEQGFLDFVRTSPTETLFFDARRTKGGSRANPQSAKVGERLAAWIRKDLKIVDKKVAPNHAWRHRFRSQLKGKVATEVLDGIDGHAPKTQGAEYGSVYPEESLAAVSQIPAYRFDAQVVEDDIQTPRNRGRPVRAR